MDPSTVLYAGQTCHFKKVGHLLEGRDCVSHVLCSPETTSCWKQNQPEIFPMTLLMASCQERTRSPLPSSQKPKALPAPSRNKAAGQRKPLRLGVAGPGSLHWGTAQGRESHRAESSSGPSFVQEHLPIYMSPGGFQELICGQYVCITASSWPFLSSLFSSLMV